MTPEERQHKIDKYNQAIKAAQERVKALQDEQAVDKTEKKDEGTHYRNSIRHMWVGRESVEGSLSGDLEPFMLSGVFNFGIGNRAQAPKDTRTEQQKLLDQIEVADDHLTPLEEEREYALSMAYTLMQQKYVGKHYNEKIAAEQSNLSCLHARLRQLQDALNEPPEVAAERDGVAMRLLEWD